MMRRPGARWHGSAIVSFDELHGCAWLGGIGFTMSLFIATIAFGGKPLVASARLGIIAGSLLAGIVAAVVLRAGDRRST